MEQLVPLAHEIAAALKDRRQTIAVAESSTGGLVSAALLAVPGASAYFAGAVVVYTGAAREQFMQIGSSAVAGMRSATEGYAMLLARAARDRLATTWGLAESGAAGPAGNRHGDAPGHTCLAICGPVERAITLETGSADRLDNMRAFSRAALDMLLRCLREA